MLETGTVALMPFKPSEPGKAISLPRTPMLPMIAIVFRHLHVDQRHDVKNTR